MHPAPSIIIFTTLSGLGFGMLFWLGTGTLSPTGLAAFIFYALAFALSVGGLLSSVFHLGHPERALRAFTQWRTSWLSREGWAAAITLLLFAATASSQIFAEKTLPLLGIIGAIAALTTVYCTSMIYTQIRAVPRWAHWSTPLIFLSFSLAGGAFLTGQIWAAAPLLILAGLVQLLNWMLGDKQFSASGTTLKTATGLGQNGDLRAFEPPHTGDNYLLREMAYIVGRKHALKLRIIAFFLLIIIPVLLLLAPLGHLLAAVAVLSHIAGAFISRWLFFAQAEHVVGLYYGKR